MDVFKLKRGNGSLIVSIPHAGTHVPDRILRRLTQDGRRLSDTDWHLPKLYDFIAARDVTILEASYSRYVVDVNRSPQNELLYPGQYESKICPTETFEGRSIYEAGQEPADAEIAERLSAYWAPYHDALAGEIERVRREHGFAVVFDAHSICNQVSRLFEGLLPDLNVGTNSGRSCTAGIADAVMSLARSATGYSAVLNGRFKGGYITRHYGRPDAGVHAIQLELSQATYMNQAYPFDFIDSKATKIRPLLQNLIQSLEEAPLVV